MQITNAVLLGFLGFTNAAPEASAWPETFTQSFTETVTYPIIGTKKTQGVYYYDVSDPTNMLTRIDRDNGQWDRYCGLTHGAFSASKCNQYISEGDRYLYYPESEDCCYCCSADHGCGVLKNTWMSDGDFLDEEKMDGVDTYKWNKQGAQANWYFETKADKAGDRIPVKSDMGVASSTEFIQDFIPSTFKKSVAAGTFTLPKTCNKGNTCAFLSICTGLRAQSLFADLLQ